jgi:hypothetical protein
MIGVMLVIVSVSCRSEKGERILFDFESDSELDQFYWKCHTLSSLSEEHASHGKQSLKMELLPDEYPGIFPMISNPDWRGFSSLCFDVFNAQKTNVPLTVRIDDRKDYPGYGDRYNTTFLLAPGQNAISISLKDLRTSQTGRPLNLKEVYRVIIFVTKPQYKIILYVDYIRLQQDIGSS